MLCKTASYIRNVYEVRLCLYFAKKDGRQFTLVVPPGGQIAPQLRALLDKHGGNVAEANVEDYFVYSGAVDMSDVELEGWVLGSKAALEELGLRIKSDALRSLLRPGAEIRGQGIAELRRLLMGEDFRVKNIDDEDVRLALIGLCEAADAAKGAVFLQ